VACLPSHGDGPSSAVIEAMAASLPVVATPVGGLPELVEEGKTGFLVPPRTPAALADRLAGLLGDPQKARALGGAGRQRVEKEFSLPALGARLASLYQTVLAGEAAERTAA
jgi:glycosyltransferase involved in cell wall biosynthesis